MPTDADYQSLIVAQTDYNGVVAAQISLLWSMYSDVTPVLLKVARVKLEAIDLVAPLLRDLVNRTIGPLKIDAAKRFDALETMRLATERQIADVEKRTVAASGGVAVGLMSAPKPPDLGPDRNDARYR